MDFISRIKKLENIPEHDNVSSDELKKYKRVYYYSMSMTRKHIVDSILKHGIDLHVVGETWKTYEMPSGAKMTILPDAEGDEVLELLMKSKIALNAMRDHKGAMTERITDTMLSGAVCLTDSTVYLNDNFIDNEDIVMYDLNDMAGLCQKIDKLLANDGLRTQIAKKAYERALKECWDERAGEIIRHINNGTIAIFVKDIPNNSAPAILDANTAK